MTDKLGPPPQPFKDFSALFPGIAKAWQTLSSSGSAGPLDDKTQRLIKLGIVIGSRSEGSTHDNEQRLGLEKGAGTLAGNNGPADQTERCDDAD